MASDDTRTRASRPDVTAPPLHAGISTGYSGAAEELRRCDSPNATCHELDVIDEIEPALMGDCSRDPAEEQGQRPHHAGVGQAVLGRRVTCRRPEGLGKHPRVATFGVYVQTVPFLPG